MSEKRRGPRQVSSHDLEVAWGDAGGVLHRIRAICVDVSEGGMRLKSTVKLPLHENVHFKFKKIRFSGTARIRQVTWRGTYYIFGAEFTGGLKWRDAARD
ncbi:MAG TPA: PilZ domain-containing protein [Bryobacteraceae bacterium]|nr:PilZ domain-containing protein [Bryobacterales bacterium]HEU0143103.1 PilZ domain-containing protein [Bryobacteraceae bacterium]